jgi:hypothetical protein
MKTIIKIIFVIFIIAFITGSWNLLIPAISGILFLVIPLYLVFNR